MEGYLIYRRNDAERNKYYIPFYEKACAKHGATITLKYFEDFSFSTAQESFSLLYQGASLTKPDFLIMRADEPAFSERLEQMGYRVFNNARVSAIANDKFKTLQLASTLNIPTPITRLANKENALQGSLILGYPLVIKPCDGHGGQDVLWVDSQETLQKILSNYQHETFLLQKPVSDLGKDLRVYILGGKPIAAMLRCRENDFRSNYCLGGSAQKYELTDRELRMIKKITDALDIDYAGIDFMFHEGKAVLNEMEDVVGARMLYHLTDIDVVDLYVKHIVKILKEQEPS